VTHDDPFPELVALLVSELTALFRHVQAAHPDEHFYGFGLISSGMFYHLTPACSSEESLRRAAERESAYNPNLTVEEHMARMRWRADSWQEYFLDTSDIPQVTAWHQAHVPDFNNLPWHEWDSRDPNEDFYGIDAWQNRVHASLMVALPLLGRSLFPNAQPEMHIDYESEVYLLAVGAAPSQR
jgi:hypothetical protein